MTRYLDDYAVGDRFLSAGRTVTEADIVSFAGLSGDFNPLHMDEHWVREHTPFRGRIAHGMLVASISSGLRTPGLEDLEMLAYLEVSRVMKAPVYPGDTIRVESVIEELRESTSRPGTGVVTLAIEVLNERDELVQSGKEVILASMAPAEVEVNSGGPR